MCYGPYSPCLFVSTEMRIYLDLCVYNRPFDDQRQPRIVIETMEFLFLLGKASSGEITVVNSFALENENADNPYIDRRDIIADILSSARESIDYDEALGKRAREIERLGIMGMDAIHIACAERAEAEIFITCDDLLVRKCEMKKGKIKVKVKTLMKFINEEVFKI